MTRAPVPAAPSPVAMDALKGFVATGLLAAVQHQDGGVCVDRRTLRLALQGACALGSGAAFIQSWQQRRAGRACVQAGLGLAAILTIEQLLADREIPEQVNEQEEQA